MRKRLMVLLLAPLCAALVLMPDASAAPPSSDPSTAARFAASWLEAQVNAQGFIPQAADPTQPNLSTSAQAVIALVAAGALGNKVDALEAYLGAHVDEFVAKGGNDDPGALAYLIMGAVPTGANPADFGTGHVNLVARLQATKQPNGLFGAADPTFDGAFRQGLALMALKVVGITDAAAADWLVGQQCADGLWTAFRADTTTPCPAVDPNTFTGPDTNSTALAVLGLQAQGRAAPAANGATALLAVRNSGGGWGFLARSDQPTDANSTGLVVTALRAANGSQDPQGSSALMALQAGCDAAAADIGGIAFQDLASGPDALATAQATPALAGVVLPQSSATFSDPVFCAAPPDSTTETTMSTPEPVESPPLARTGTSAMGEAVGALALLAAGILLVELAQLRRRRPT